MDTLAIIKLSIFDGKLRPEDADLGRDIIERYGEETFHHFLAFREMDEQQARINQQLRVSEALVTQYSH